MTSPLGEAALHYHSQGLRIFPLAPNANVPYKTGSQGYKLFKNAKAEGLTEAEIRSFWADNKKANIGLWTGNKSGLSAIDIDVDEFGDGNARLAELVANTQIPRGAKHYFHAFDDGSVKVYWKSHRKEHRWVPVNFGRSGSNGVTWEAIVKHYL